MNEAVILEIGRDATWVIFIVAGPLLAVGTAVGLIVALLQALTTIQEASLTFVPKIAAVLLSMLLLLPFMMTTLIEFTRRLFDHMAYGG